MSEAPEKHEATGEPRPMSFIAGAAWTIGAMALLFVLESITQSIRPGAERDLINDAACAVLGYSVVTLLMLRVYAPNAPMRGMLGLRAVSPFHLMVALIAGAAIGPGLELLGQVVEQRFPVDEKLLELTRELYTMPTRASRIAYLVAYAVVLPLVQELFFRVMLFGGLRRGRPLGLAVQATAVFFASSWPTVSGFSMMLVFGLVLATLRAQSGSVLSPIAASLGYQLVTAGPIALGRDPLADVVYPKPWVAGGIALAALALAAGRAIASRDPRAAAAVEDDE